MKKLALGFALALAFVASADTFQGGAPASSFTQTGVPEGSVPPPAAGSGTIFTDSPVTGVPPILGVMTDLGFAWDPAAFSYHGGAGPRWGCFQIINWSSLLQQFGFFPGTTALGAVFGETWANTSILTRTPRNSYFTGGANTTSGWANTTLGWWRGNAAGRGGFVWWASAAIVSTVATQRVAFAMRQTTGAPPAAADPSTMTDTVYVGCDSADTNLSICSNDSAGAATCTTLGANFPCKTANAYYSVWFWSAPNGSTIGYAVQRHDSAFSTSGTLSSNLPSNTAQFGTTIYINSGATAAPNAQLSFTGNCVAWMP